MVTPTRTRRNKALDLEMNPQRHQVDPPAKEKNCNKALTKQVAKLN